jgi:hypothetical protein
MPAEQPQIYGRLHRDARAVELRQGGTMHVHVVSLMNDVGLTLTQRETEQVSAAVQETTKGTETKIFPKNLQNNLAKSLKEDF